MAVEPGTTGTITGPAGDQWPDTHIVVKSYTDAAGVERLDVESESRATGFLYGRLDPATHQPLGPIAVTLEHAASTASIPESWFTPNPVEPEEPPA